CHQHLEPRPEPGPVPDRANRRLPVAWLDQPTGAPGISARQTASSARGHRGSPPTRGRAGAWHGRSSPSAWWSRQTNTSLKMRRAGALVERLGDGSQTRVEWPGETLRDFMLFDVLMHEIGHHLIQQYTGKRTARVARTREHEAFAELFARQCRQAYLAQEAAR